MNGTPTPLQQEAFRKKMLAPVYKKDTLQIEVKRYFTDVLGTIVNKAAVPAALQIDYPVYVFGEYDRVGAYQLGIKNLPSKPGVFYYCSYVWGVNSPFIFGFTGLSNIEGQLNPGDLVTVYTDNLNAPNYFVFIVQRCSGKSLASILQNLPALPYDADYGYINVKKLQYYTDNLQQWKENLLMLNYDFLGLVQSDGVSPISYRPAISLQDQFIEIVWTFTLTQYAAMNTYMLFATDLITFTFQVEHRLNELTQKRKRI